MATNGKALTLETAALSTLVRRPPPPMVRAMLDLLCGRKPDREPWGADGCLLAPGVGLARERGESRYSLCLHLAGEWVQVASAAAYDPAILEHQDSLTVYPRNPKELEAEQRRQEIERMSNDERRELVLQEHERQGGERWEFSGSPIKRRSAPGRKFL